MPPTRLPPSISVFIALLMCALVMVGFQNCGRFSTAALQDSFTSLCSGQSLSKLKAMVAAAPVVDANCSDSSSYKCVVRIFRPGVGNEKVSHHECLRNGQCMEVEVMNFDTNAALRAGDLPAGSFDEGGEYNHDIFECDHLNARVEGVAILTAEASTLEEAWQNVHARCEERSRHAR